MATQHARGSGSLALDSPLRLDDEARESANGDAIPALRRFHLTGRGSSDLPGGLLPALLHPYRDPSGVRDGYPVFVPTPETERDRDARTTAVVTLTELLRRASADAFEGTEGKVLTDNIDRLELAVRRDMAGKSQPADANETLEITGTTMLAGLGLHAGAASEAQEAFRRLLGHVPSGYLVPANAETPLHLLTLAKAQASDARYEEARRELREIHTQLGVRLDVDRSKRDAGRAPDTIARSFGGAVGRFLQPEQVAPLMGRVRGSVPMAPERRARIEHAWEAIGRFLDSPVETRTTVVMATGRVRRLEGERFHVVTADDPLAAAHETAVATAATVLDLCRAVRLARLELHGRYDPLRHDEWLSALCTETLESEERDLLPPIVVLVDTTDVVTTWVSSLSRVLRAPWRIAVVSLTKPLRPLDSEPAVDVGYFGVGHRRAFVQQASISRPVHFYEGLVRSLSAARPSLHVVDIGDASDGSTPSIGRWLRAGAAVEGRAHPLFRFDPLAGPDWATRFDLDENPEPEAPWSVAEISVAGAGEPPREISTAFTLADLALLDPGLSTELAHVRCGESDALVTVDRYLEMSGDERAGHVPYVWAADESGRLHRIAVTERLCRASEERRDFWHTLQELAGIRNAYVERAEARVRETLEADANERLRRADGEHSEAMERARAEAASGAMDALARYLLSMDTDALPASVSGTGTVTTEAEKPAEHSSPSADVTVDAVDEEAPAAPEPVAEEAAADADGFEEPWIETALCTSCNDCTIINPKLFVYDGNKQAHIGDPDAGTFAELVAAAEKCPARCIHPGKPRNPNEPNLEELVSRAAPFNT